MRFTLSELSGELTESSRLSTTLNYMPLSRPSPPSRLRQLAYMQHTALLGPDSDPEGWRSSPSSRTRGKLLSASRSVEAKCRVRSFSSIGYGPLNDT